jgi:hypothetical protein
LLRPAAVGPREDHAGTVSLRSLLSPLSSYAPTVRTIGSSAGLVMVPACGPELPAATTTTMPCCHSRWTAWLSGSTAGSCVLSVPHDRFSTRMPYWSA